MKCKTCGNADFISVSAKCSDLCYVSYKGTERNDYVPSGLNIGSGDYIELSICPLCGTLHGKFPLDDKKIIKNLKG